MKEKVVVSWSGGRESTLGDCSNERYEEAMAEAVVKCREEGIKGVIFGDIFLEDARRYREDNLAKLGMKADFPFIGKGYQRPCQRVYWA